MFNKKNHFIKSISLILFAVGLFCCYDFLLAQSPDAIAIRVVPNPTHASALEWYKSNNFQGSPQALLVDGYSAIRDGRTVYVNAANSAANTIYTNIYIISYTQEAEKSTTNIFTRIVASWTFNENLSTLLGHCRGSIKTPCLKDSECPINDFCDSKKSRIVRDTKRLEDFASLQKALTGYKEAKGHYPKMDAGTYLPGKTISVWPSWEKAFSEALGIRTPKDPVNKLGLCGNPRFNEITCWDEVNKEFYDTTPNIIDLPKNSLAYIYNGKNDGSGYSLCAAMESGSILPFGMCSGMGICISAP